MDDSDNFSAQVIERVQTNNNNDDSQTDYNENAIPQIRVYQNHLRRNLICFWIIGLCGGIGASILSSASFDVIKRLEGGSNSSTNASIANHTRDCITDMPAVLLLANTIPSLALKFILPFIPFYTKTNIIASCVLAIASFVIVAVSQYKWQAILGIIFMSFSSDLNDITSMAYLAKFKDRRKIIISYSGGGGVSGVVATSLYTTICDIGFTPTTTLYIMLVVPLVGLAAFFFIKESNITNSPQLLDDEIDEVDENDSHSSEVPEMSLAEKWRYLPKLTKYFVPMLICSLLDYMTGQTFDLLYVPGTRLNHADQFRWISTISEYGSLFGRLALSYIWIDDIWSLNLLSATFMAYFYFESIYMTIPNIWVIFFFIFLISFVSDYTALNIYYQFTNETPPQHQVFGICSISIGLTVATLLAGSVAIPIHSIICQMPSPF